jgi:hypothetical protein
MAYNADPGGVFASDTHRRVLAHVTEDSLDLQTLGRRISQDQYHGLAHVDELEEVLKDLEADGYVSNAGGGWKVLKKGTEALAAPVPDADAGGDATPAVLGGLNESASSD